MAHLSLICAFSIFQGLAALHQKLIIALLLGNKSMHVHIEVQDYFHFYRLPGFELFKKGECSSRIIMHMPQINVYLCINYNSVLHIRYY